MNVFTQYNKWILPLLYTLLRELLELSTNADRILLEQGKQSTHLEESARSMSRAFSVCATDRLSDIDNSRKWGVYHVVNLLFKTYFKVYLVVIMCS